MITVRLYARTVAQSIYCPMIKPRINSICIVRLSAFGDVLMLVPLIRTLQDNFPNARLTWVISSFAYELISGLDGVEFIVIDKPQSLKDYWHFRALMRNRKFDVLLAAQASLRANLLYPWIKAKRKIGYDRLRAKDGHHWFINETITPGRDHTLEGFLKFAALLGVEKNSLRWDLPISTTDTDWTKQQVPETAGPIVIINPAASKPERSWMPERYIEIIKYIKQHWNACIVLTGGPSAHDIQLGDTIESHTSVINLIGKTKPRQLLALIKRASLVICPDTGPAHMAAAVTTPVIALHAVTSAKVSGPYIYQHLAVDKYPLAVETVLHKTMQTVTWGTHAHGVETMQLVSVDDVIKQLETV